MAHLNISQILQRKRDAHTITARMEEHVGKKDSRWSVTAAQGTRGHIATVNKHISGFLTSNTKQLLVCLILV